MPRRFRFFLSLFFILLPVEAGAISVVNMDTVTHQISVAVTPGQEKVIDLAPGESWRTFSPNVAMRLLDGRTRGEIHARDLDEYVIWRGGELAVQKRRIARRRF